jgi:transcriptional regulator with XRE-family HTH domain
VFSVTTSIKKAASFIIGVKYWALTHGDAPNKSLNYYLRDEKMSSQHAPRSPNPVDIHVGTRVRLRRQVLKMSQEKLGDQLGVTFQQVQKYERGSNRVGASRLWKMAQVMDVPVGFFYEGLEESMPSSEFGEGDQTPIIYDFINSTDGVSLAMAVSQIKSKGVRRQILELARSLAKDQDD